MDSRRFSKENLAFLFPAEEVILQHRYDDCCGMSNFFVLKHRCSQDWSVSSIPIMACPPFRGQLEGFDKYWSVDNCQVILPDCTWYFARRCSLPKGCCDE
jgi:hypothetical protein